MKLKSLLKVTNSVKINIIDNEASGFKTYKVDYLKKSLEVENYGSFEIHTSVATLPKELLDRTVKYVSVNMAEEGMIDISMK